MRVSFECECEGFGIWCGQPRLDAEGVAVREGEHRADGVVEVAVEPEGGHVDALRAPLRGCDVDRARERAPRHREAEGDTGMTADADLRVEPERDLHRPVRPDRAVAHGAAVHRGEEPRGGGTEGGGDEVVAQIVPVPRHVDDPHRRRGVPVGRGAGTPQLPVGRFVAEQVAASAGQDGRGAATREPHGIAARNHRDAAGDRGHGAPREYGARVDAGRRDRAEGAVGAEPCAPARTEEVERLAGKLPRRARAGGGGHGHRGPDRRAGDGRDGEGRGDGGDGHETGP